LVNERKDAKKLVKAALNELDAEVADQKQLGLKIAANSLYGFLGMINVGKYPLLEGAQAICGVGRDAIIKCATYMVDTHKCTLIYGDTDSIMYTYPRDPSRTTKETIALAQTHAIELSGLFPAPMKLELEKVMHIICRMKKNYAYLSADDNGVYNHDRKDLTIKGMVPTRRDNTAFTTNVFMDVLMARFKDSNPLQIYNIIKDYACRLFQGKIPLKDLVISMGLSDHYDSNTSMMYVFSEAQRLRGQPLRPGRIEFYVVEGVEGENIGNRLRVYDESNPVVIEKIDYEYYLTSQFMKPLDALCEVLWIEQLRRMKGNPVVTVGKKKGIRVDQPAKAISYTLIEHVGFTAADNFFTSNFSKIDTRVKYENNFFTPRAK
jgi:DNA polymerase elongation subunit (family B)